MCGGGGVYLNMKLVYICRALFKNRVGGLKSGPSLKMRGGGVLSERPLTGKTGDLGVKNNIFIYVFKTTVFSLSPGRKSRTMNCIFLKRGSFGVAYVETVE